MNLKPTRPWFPWYGTIFVVAILAIVLTGCHNATTSGYKPYKCNTCVGPYDVSLTSHREALYGKNNGKP
jgi:PBP1b-binding outer membrane lipoprotein LpoB